MMNVSQMLRMMVDRLFWTWRPKSEKESGEAVVRNLLLHWFPNRVSIRSLSWTYSLWLGTVSAVLFFILVVTGIVLMFLYVPSVERAYSSVKDLEYVVSFGPMMRNMHRIAAHLMVGAVVLHMIRVFLTGAYKNGSAVGAARPLNWLVGLVLLILTLLLSFTGYLLPWDQLAYWAITVGTNIASAAPLVGEQIRYVLLGGHTIDQNTLLRFYVLHVAFLPVILTALFAYHMWRIRKDGGLASADQDAQRTTMENVPPVKTKTYSLLGLAKGTTVHVSNAMVDEEQHTVASVPHLTRRLLLVALTTVFVVLVLAILFPAPLEAPANPSVTPNPAKAPWYFLWLQELVTITTVPLGPVTINGALIGGILIPALLVLGAAWWPWRDRSGVHAVGVWFSRERRRQNAVFLILCLLITILLVVGTFMRGPYWEFFWPWESWPTTPVSF